MGLFETKEGTLEKMKNGEIILPIVSFATKMLPYSGIGSGIPRIIKKHPDTKLINNADGEQFTIILNRPGNAM